MMIWYLAQKKGNRLSVRRSSTSTCVPTLFVHMFNEETSLVRTFLSYRNPQLQIGADSRLPPPEVVFSL